MKNKKIFLGLLTSLALVSCTNPSSSSTPETSSTNSSSSTVSTVISSDSSSEISSVDSSSEEAPSSSDSSESSSEASSEVSSEESSSEVSSEASSEVSSEVSSDISSEVSSEVSSESSSGISSESSSSIRDGYGEIIYETKPHALKVTISSFNSSYIEEEVTEYKIGKSHTFRVLAEDNYKVTSFTYWEEGKPKNSPYMILEGYSDNSYYFSFTMPASGKIYIDYTLSACHNVSISSPSGCSAVLYGSDSYGQGDLVEFSVSLFSDLYTLESIDTNVEGLEIRQRQATYNRLRYECSFIMPDCDVVITPVLSKDESVSVALSSVEAGIVNLTVSGNESNGHVAILDDDQSREGQFKYGESLYLYAKSNDILKDVKISFFNADNTEVFSALPTSTSYNPATGEVIYHYASDHILTEGITSISATLVDKPTVSITVDNQTDAVLTYYTNLVEVESLDGFRKDSLLWVEASGSGEYSIVVSDSEGNPLSSESYIDALDVEHHYYVITSDVTVTVTAA